MPLCLDSLTAKINNHNPDWEIIVVNDGSTDRTSEIAHDFEKRHPGAVRVIDKPNGHYGSCVNAAIPVAQGEYIKIIDADDTCDPEQLAAFVSALNERVERPDMIISDYRKVSPSGKIVSEVRFPLPTDRDFSPDEAMTYGNVFVQLHAVTHRRANLLAMGYRQLEGMPYTDFQWALTPITAVRKIAYLPFSVVRYLVGREGQSVAPDTVTRDADIQAQVSLAIYRQYREALAKGLPHCANYYAYHLLRNYAWMVQLYALGINGRLPSGSGEAFDRQVQELLPKIHAEADQYALKLQLLPFLRITVRFRYIHDWRRRYSRDTIGFRLFRIRARIIRLFVRDGR